LVGSFFHEANHGRVLLEDDAKALLEKRMAELEWSNAHLKLDLEHSYKTLAMLQSSHSKKQKFCNGLKSRNPKLHKAVQDVEYRAKFLEEEKMTIELLHSKASLPDVFAAVNKNFTAIALEVVLNMLKIKKCTHIYVLHKVAFCGMMIFSSVPHDVKKIT
jgi:hypothetical protein